MMQVLTRKLSVFYALYFGLLGCIAPYWGLFLQDKHYSPEQIGLLMGCFGLMRIIAPSLWAHWSRYFASPLQMVRIAAIFTLVCFACVAFVKTFLDMALIMMLYGFFWAAMLPQYEVMTMRACKNEIGLYSRIRVWGSIGFVATVALAGFVFEWIAVSWLPLIMFVLIVLITINSFQITDTSQAEQTTHSDLAFWPLIFSKKVMIFLLMVILLQISHGPYYTFFSIYLGENGYASSTIGLLWSVGVLAEVLLFWFFQRIVSHFSWIVWGTSALFITALRWFVVATLVDIVWIMFISQLAHAFSFAVMHAVSMHYVHHLFPASMNSRAQALYASAGFGLGGALGAFASGALWQPLGGAWVFAIAGICAFIGMLLAWFGLRKYEQSLSQKA